MISKEKEKKKAIELRKQGLSYNEVLKRVSVAKSTLSLWLQSVDLSKRQKQRLTAKRLEAAKRGGEARRSARISAVDAINVSTKKDIQYITDRELWLIGIALYWAEGSKEKEYRPGSSVQFTNSDVYMIKLFLKWLLEICKVNKKSIDIDIYIHENSKNNITSVVTYWSTAVGFPKDAFSHIYYKKNNVKTNRKNKGVNYYGVLKIKVRASSILLRKIAGWVKAINYYCQVV